MRLQCLVCSAKKFNNFSLTHTNESFMNFHVRIVWCGEKERNGVGKGKRKAQTAPRQEKFFLVARENIFSQSESSVRELSSYSLERILVRILCALAVSSCVTFIVIFNHNQTHKKKQQACRPAKLTVYKFWWNKFVNFVAPTVCENRSSERTEEEEIFSFSLSLLQPRNQLIQKQRTDTKNSFTPFSTKWKGSAAKLNK